MRKPNKAIYYFLFISLFLSAARCNPDKDEETDTHKLANDNTRKQNYIVLLDLSDRILPEYAYNGDKEIVKHIFKTVVERQKSRIQALGLDLVDDQMSFDKIVVRIAPQNNIPYKKIEYENGLRLDLATVEKHSFKDIFSGDYLTTLFERCEKLYNSARYSNRSEDYKGSSLYKYFNDGLEGDLDKEADNYLFILTDGYFDFEDSVSQIGKENKSTSSKFYQTLRLKKENWEDEFDKIKYGILPTGKNYTNTKAIVLQIAPKNEEFMYEFPMIKKTWNTWLQEMDIECFPIRNMPDLSTSKSDIDKFLNTTTSDKASEIKTAPAVKLATENTSLNRQNSKADLSKKENTSISKPKSTTGKDELEILCNKIANPNLGQNKKKEAIASLMSSVSSDVIITNGGEKMGISDFIIKKLGTTKQVSILSITKNENGQIESIKL